ncbi:hypothetical protein NKG05_11760 [Oerskovia sp. M15]
MVLTLSDVGAASRNPVVAALLLAVRSKLEEFEGKRIDLASSLPRGPPLGRAARRRRAARAERPAGLSVRVGEATSPGPRLAEHAVRVRRTCGWRSISRLDERQPHARHR